jgi:cytochrome P450
VTEGKRGEIAGFDLMDPLVHADPYPTYEWLRRNAPVYHLAGSQTYVISRFADVERILHDHHTFGSDLGFKVPLMSMVMMDAPDHTRLRQTFNRAFTPRNIQQLSSRIEAITEDLVSGLGGPCEFVQALANPLPVTVICEMLGVPLKQRNKMNRYARDALLASFARTGMGSSELRAEAEVGLRALMEILDEAIAMHVKNPQDNIISSLVAEERKGVVTREELRNLCAVLLIAGHETTANLLANGGYILASRPELFQSLQEDQTVIPSFVEELCRTRPPLQRIMRRAKTAVEVAGAPIPAGSLLMLLPGSANRDSERWSDPDQFDIDRVGRGHLGFGAGVHVCPGASLTRLEAKIAFEVLVRRVRGLTLDPDRRPSPIIGYGAGSLGWNTMPLIVDV